MCRTVARQIFHCTPPPLRDPRACGCGWVTGRAVGSASGGSQYCCLKGGGRQPSPPPYPLPTWGTWGRGIALHPLRPGTRRGGGGGTSAAEDGADQRRRKWASGDVRGGRTGSGLRRAVGLHRRGGGGGGRCFTRAAPRRPSHADAGDAARSVHPQDQSSGGGRSPPHHMSRALGPFEEEVRGGGGSGPGAGPPGPVCPNAPEACVVPRFVWGQATARVK